MDDDTIVPVESMLSCHGEERSLSTEITAATAISKATKATVTASTNDASDEDAESLLLPNAVIKRMMKNVIPSNAKIAKDAIITVQECASELISFVTSEAADRCQQEKRKIVGGEDIIWALESLGFSEYVTPLKIYLAQYRAQNAHNIGTTKKS